MGKYENELGGLKPIFENPKTGKIEPITDQSEWNKAKIAYDSNTKVVYYITTIETHFSISLSSACPYISENGKYCRLVDGKIVEIG